MFLRKFLLLLLPLFAMNSFGQVKKTVTKTPVTKVAAPKPPKYGALAVDRTNGFYYGFSFDHATPDSAKQRALDECRQKGGNCSVVLLYSGPGCGAYRTISGTVGTAFGWGLAATKEQADAIATKECLKRSKGISPTNFVYSCNSADKQPVKELYNASGEIFASVKIGNQVWSAENLNINTYANGDPIPEAKTYDEFINAAKEKRGVYFEDKNAPANGSYGKLYSYYALNDKRGLAPQGWHVATKSDFQSLINYLGGEASALTKLKSKTAWPRRPGKDAYGFNALPGGYMQEKMEYDYFCNWWTSTLSDAGNPPFMVTCHVAEYETRDVAEIGSQGLYNGCYIRLVKN